MRAVDLIRKKRDGGALDEAEIRFFVQGVTDGSIPDYQAAALLMAIVLRGMDAAETAALTGAMVDSGIRVDLSDIPGTKVDKHSTGGVGDKTSLILAPLAAACGAIVPMMSGRALGHTGGTLDKLESIPGFRTGLSLEEFRGALSRTGCGLIGQTSTIAPADKKLYALRDVTSTVESIPLISASIMSKKIAEGIDVLVLDVKTGRGAFMKTEEDSRRLAESLVAIGKSAGLRTTAFITAMDTPLGNMVGNALEVIESIETLKGNGPPDLESLSVTLTGQMLALAGLAGSLADGEELARGAIRSGAGVDKFRAIVEQQGGDPRVVDDYSILPSAPRQHVVTATRGGYVSALDAFHIGLASNALGAGRSRVDDVVDPGVGVIVRARPGARISGGDAILELRYTDDARLASAVELASRAIEIGDDPPPASPLVLHTVD